MRLAKKNQDTIAIHGAREHNLKNLTVFIPRFELTVITGVSGSGKSSLAFDTLYAEGYRKYIDSLSTRAKLMLEQIKRPEVDYIEGLSPVIAIEQHASTSTNPRSTVATITEIADYARLLWAVGGTPYCPKDQGIIQKRSIDDCINRILEEPESTKAVLLAPYMEGKASIILEELPFIKQRGFQRVRINNTIHLIDDISIQSLKGKNITLDIVIDRLLIQKEDRSRIADSLELAFREGKDKAICSVQKDNTWHDIVLSQQLSCHTCGTHYPQLEPRFFSYTNPEGVCPACQGIGKTLQFQEYLVVPDTSKSINEGALKALRIGTQLLNIRHKAMLRQLSQQVPFSLDTPWEKLEASVRNLLLYGSEDIFNLKLNRRRSEPQTFPGAIAIIDHLFKHSKSDFIRSRLMAFQTTSACKECEGSRLNKYLGSVLLNQTSFSDFMNMSLLEAHQFTKNLIDNPHAQYPKAIQEGLIHLEKRLHFLNQVGLGYLSLNREYNTLSGGESQRVRLATQLGMGLVGVLYILDEPSIGLHAQDNNRLIDALTQLKDLGNTVVVVEHDEAIMHQATHLIEMGPQAGSLGGQILFEGSLKDCLKNKKSRTGQYLSQSIRIQKNTTEKKPSNLWLKIKEARENNLKNIDADFPVGLLTCVCGLSGSGKSTLVNDILAQAAANKLNKAKTIPGLHKKIQGLEHFQRLVQVDQSPIGLSPRSNPATFTKLFDLLRDLFSQCPLSKVRGYTASRFSFNMRGGRCERCQGDGAIKVDMQFLDDVYTQCPSCEGKRYNRETLEVRFKGYSISDVLGLTVDQAHPIFKSIPRIVKKLEFLQAVGLGYIQLGQSATTLSGGEAQRLKLALELSRSSSASTLYILDEPTTGLHWDDIQHLLDLLYKLRDAGHTLIVIEHHLDIIRLADWTIELGPTGGPNGGYVLFNGPPSILAEQKTPTGLALKNAIKPKKA